MTLAQAVAAATAVKQIANSLKAAKVVGKEFSVYNGVTDPGWGSITNGNDPELVDANGFLIGTQFVPGDISNAIGSLNAFLAIYEGTQFNFGTGNITPNRWGDSIEKISDPLV